MPMLTCDAARFDFALDAVFLPRAVERGIGPSGFLNGMGGIPLPEEPGRHRDAAGGTAVEGIATPVFERGDILAGSNL